MKHSSSSDDLIRSLCEVIATIGSSDSWPRHLELRHIRLNAAVRVVQYGVRHRLGLCVGHVLLISLGGSDTSGILIDTTTVESESSL